MALERQGADSPRSPANVGAALTCLALVAGMILSLPWFERWSPLGLLARSTHRPEQDLEEAVVRLREEGKPANIFTTAIARELSGFVWAIARQVTVTAG